MARVDLPAGNLRARRRRRRLLVALVVCGVCLLIFTFLVGVSYAPFMRIETVTVTGAETLKPEKLQSLVQEVLTGSYAYTFAKSNIFIYPHDQIAAAVEVSNPIVKHVEVKAEDLHTVSVAVVERTPKAVYCYNGCFLMDEDGIVYEQAPEFSSPVYVKYEGKATGKKLPKQFLTIDQFHSLAALVDALAQNQGVRVERGVVDSTNDVHVMFENGFELLFVLSDEGGDVFERFTLALKSDVFKGHTITDFEYLDLRFGDKLYYKLKGV